MHSSVLISKHDVNTDIPKYISLITLCMTHPTRTHIFHPSNTSLPIFNSGPMFSTVGLNFILTVFLFHSCKCTPLTRQRSPASPPTQQNPPSSPCESIFLNPLTITISTCTHTLRILQNCIVCNKI